MRTAVFLVCSMLWGATAAVRAQTPVTLEAITDRKFYRENASSEVHIEARIGTAPAPAGAVATPAVRNVALVLDRSGSMAGAPLEALRQAAKGAIETLAADDIVAVVLFGSEVETLIEAQRRDQIRDLDTRLAQIETAGGAALYDALNQAAAQLRRHAGPATLNRLILITDGPATKGPREGEDFVRLAEVFAREGTLLSAIGLGPEFNEDMLAAMARTAHGGFRYVAEPAGLADALRAELAPRPAVVGHDAVLTVDFTRFARKLRSHGWRTAMLGETSVTYRFPRLLAGQPLRVLASTELDAFYARFEFADFATVKLSWKTNEGETRELSRVVPLRFSTDGRDVRESLDPGVALFGAEAAIRQGLQKAIEQLDQGDPRRALRLLRTARSEARDINFDLEDPRINEAVRKLDAYLAEVQPRGLGAADRKILRSGLLNQFEPPATIVEPKK